MRNIIWDHFRRWWWVWLICVIANSVLILVISACNYKFGAFFPFGMFMGALLLAFDIQRGHIRSVVSLPVTAKQVARAWWWLAVGLPGAVILIMTFLVFSAFACWRHDWSALPSCAVFCVSNFLTLAAMFYALTGLPRTGAVCFDWKDRMRGYVFSGVWGISFASWLLFQNVALTTVSGLGILLAAVCLTIMGWFRAERLVRDRALSLATSPASRGKSAKPSDSMSGYGGLAFLAQSIFTRLAFMGVAMFAVLAVILPFMKFYASDSAPTDLTDFLGDIFPIFAFQLLWAMAIQIIFYTTHIRYLRTLPISATKLAAVLVFTTLAAMLLLFYGTMLLLSAIFQVPLPGPEKIVQQGALLPFAAATTMVPLFIWRPMEVLTFFIMMATMIGGMFAVVFSHHLAAGITVTASGLIILGAFIATKTLLERSSRTYRPRTNQFAGLNWGGGQ